MPRTSALALVVAVALGGCETSPVAPTYVPGPPVPSVPTAAPYVWDSADELASWVNVVSSDAARVVVEDGSAFLRITIPARAYGLPVRSPDLDPPCVGLRNVRLRYRWIAIDPGGVSGGTSGGYLGSVQPLDPPWPAAALTGSLNWEASGSRWQETVLTVQAGGSDCGGPCPGTGGSVDARHIWLTLSSPLGGDISTRFEIDTIALVR
jgi:hypothetical protein